jgi:hypothetical protein
MQYEAPRPDWVYVPRYNRGEYQRLYDISRPEEFVKGLLHGCQYRDKRIQRWLFVQDPVAYETLMCPRDEIGLHVNSSSLRAQAITRWRITIAK